MGFEPENIQVDDSLVSTFFKDASGEDWTPIYRHGCEFDDQIFTSIMLNLIKNPNINSSWLFRADILYDKDENGDENGCTIDGEHADVQPILRDIQGMTRQRTLVRRLIPRNERRDAPLDQTCIFYQSAEGETGIDSLLLYIPHVSTVKDMPFYHPKVRGIAHFHHYDPSFGTGNISIHFLPFPEHPIAADQKLLRTGYHLLEVLHRHGQGRLTGYVKRVHHDVVIPQVRFQNRLAVLKDKYARPLVKSWAEVTDPNKHVFEDLAIAAFLIELWADMYKDTAFPGFVDVGCGNGLLVYVLVQEGYSGWGFDARERKSWPQYKSSDTKQQSPTGSSLVQRLLLPSIVPLGSTNGLSTAIDPNDIHDGIFPPGTFIISNHADELTPWTPILATISRCPFIAIPCCSHNLKGDRYRAQPPRDKSKGSSRYASLVDWVSQIAEDCGWLVETEMLRIPSTRNTCLLGRERTTDYDNVDIDAILNKYGGVEGYYDNVAKLVATAPRSH